jgi:cell wall-associated NlpC family hydrolase
MIRFGTILLLGLILPLPAMASPFGIQVGAFREFERAEMVQEALEDAGYNSYFSEANGFKRVRVGPFASQAEAEAEVRALWPFLVARFGPQEFERPWVVVEDRRIENAPLAGATDRGHVFVDLDGEVSATAASIIDFARSLMGTRYRWGGTTTAGFDCSGYTQHVFARAGLAIPRQAKNQIRVGEEIPDDQLAPGDLVFFSTYTSGPSHVGIYIGGGEFIHSSSGSGSVTVTPLSKRYYANRYLGARRVITIEPETLREMTRLVNR